MLKQLAAPFADSGKPLRILEIGARSADLTEAFLAVLPEEVVAYTCTDQSTFFMQEAKSRFGKLPHVQCQLLDMEKDPLVQGYEAHQYDVIIAADSLHRARDIGVALSHAQSLLAPGGVLLMLELTRDSRLQQVSTAFLEDGFTGLQDERRHDQKPLLAQAAWQRVLKQSFAQVAAFPNERDAANVFGQHVIVAQAPGMDSASIRCGWLTS